MVGTRAPEERSMDRVGSSLWRVLQVEYRERGKGSGASGGNLRRMVGRPRAFASLRKRGWEGVGRR